MAVQLIDEVPRTPRLNRKVERSHRVDDQEFYQLLDQDDISDDIHLFNKKLREWENYYNFDRPHGALGGQTPYERLLAKTRAEALPKFENLHKSLYLGFGADTMPRRSPRPS